MKNQHLPHSDIDALHAMLSQKMQTRPVRPSAHFAGEQSYSRVSQQHPTVVAVGERSRPRTALPGRLNRWPFNNPGFSRFVLRAWNFASREWREIAELTRQALQSLHDRINNLEGAGLERADLQARTEHKMAAMEARIAELEARFPGGQGEPDASYLSQKEISAFMERVAERFRGDPADLRHRLGIHLEAVTNACRTVPGKPLLDLGCGHGEWLALMRDAGIPAYGVDLSSECVNACTAQKLEAIYGDALQELTDASPGKLAAVSAFHLVEHLPLAAQIALFTKAYAALAPGGVLIMETPNPENQHIMHSGFWYDPTHSRPVPAQLLKVFAEAAGFAQIETRFINPPEIPEIEIEHYPPRLRHILFCGRDTVLYAVK